MDRLEALHAFVLAVDRGSLSAAALALHRSPASLTRAVDALEARVGARLLRRTTRSLELTEAGERYLVVARRVLAELEAAERQTREGSGKPQGTLTVTAPLVFGSLHLRPVLEEFLDANLEVRVRALFVDRVVSLLEEGIDVAVRIGRLPDSSLLATPVGAVHRVVVASPAYLARHGRPKTPSDLARHRCVASTSLTPQDYWSFAGRRGARARRVKVSPVLSVNVAEAALRSAVAGLGVTCALSYQVAEHLARGSLVRLLTSYEGPPTPVHLLCPAGGAKAPKVRAFVELATKRLRAALK